MTVGKQTDAPSVAALPTVETHDLLLAPLTQLPRLSRLAWLNGRARRFEVTALFRFGECREPSGVDSVECMAWFDPDSEPSGPSKDDATRLVQAFRTTDRAPWVVPDLEVDALSKLVDLRSCSIRSLCLVPVRDDRGTLRGALGHFGTAMVEASGGSFPRSDREAPGDRAHRLRPLARPSAGAHGRLHGVRREAGRAHRAGARFGDLGRSVARSVSVLARFRSGASASARRP